MRFVPILTQRGKREVDRLFKNGTLLGFSLKSQKLYNPDLSK